MTLPSASVFYQPTGGRAPTAVPSTRSRARLLPAVFIGAMVPGVGNINNGMVQSGHGETPRGLMKDRGAHWGPRIGLAYQIDNKTVFRTGGGVFYERVATFGIGITSNYTTNPPNLRRANCTTETSPTSRLRPGDVLPDRDQQAFVRRACSHGV